MTEKKTETKLSLSINPQKTNTTNNNKIRQTLQHGRSKVVAVEVIKKRVISTPNNVAGVADKLSQNKNGNLTSIEWENRIKIAQSYVKTEAPSSENSQSYGIMASIKEEKEVADQEALAEEKQIQEAKEQAEKNALAEKTLKQDQEEKSQKTFGSVNQNNSRNESQNYQQRTRNFSNNDSPKYSNGERNSNGFNSSTTKTIDENVKNFVKESSAEEIAWLAAKKQKVDVIDDLKATKKLVLAKKDTKKEPMFKKGRFSVNDICNDEVEEEKYKSYSSIKRARQKQRNKTVSQPVEKVFREVVLPEVISVQELANRMAEKSSDVIKSLMKLGLIVTVTQTIDADTAELVILEFGHKCKRITENDLENDLFSIDKSEENLLPRPPVVTVMGHVDHGKTSLLDALRKTDVVLKESGGITQHIGAYQIHLPDDRKITFIDTPGHEAFTAMRARGATVTDIVVLVVAADDSVKEQTIEAINHAKAAGVTIIVAINKIDKPGANVDKVRMDLLQHSIVVEEMGGDVMAVPVSAKSGLNLDKLLEAILLQAEMLVLQANPNQAAAGVVIESKIEKGFGPVATVLIQHGTLSIGDVFISGSVCGKVRALYNDFGAKLEKIGPATPVEVIGFDSPSIPGDDFYVLNEESKAREIAQTRERQLRELQFVNSKKLSIEQRFAQQSADNEQKILPIIVKADVQGSVEVIIASLNKLTTAEVAVKILHSGIGVITESDIVLAKASNALIIAFNVRENSKSRELIQSEKIDVKYFSIIYDLIDVVKGIMSGYLKPILQENIIGSVEIRKIFEVSKIGKIAGCYVIDGIIKRNSNARLLRDGVLIYTTTLSSLRRLKDDVKEVKSGYECGITLENYNDIHVGDVIECFEIEKIARTL